MVDEPEFDDATKTAFARLVYKMAHGDGGKHRAGFAKLVREVEPERAAAFSDVWAKEDLEKFKVDQEEKEIKREAREIEKRLVAQRNKLLKSDNNPDGRYSEDEIKEIEGVMTRYGLTDYDPGVVLYAHEKPPAAPQPPEGGGSRHGATWEFPDFKAFVQNPVATARDRAHEVITELQRNRARR